MLVVMVWARVGVVVEVSTGSLRRVEKGGGGRRDVGAVCAACVSEGARRVVSGKKRERA